HRQACMIRPCMRWRRCTPAISPMHVTMVLELKGHDMPIYEYTCRACEKKFEQLARSMQSDVPAKCPSCGSTKTARAFSVFAVGAESSGKTASVSAAPGCGRCGGPGPCPSGF